MAPPDGPKYCVEFESRLGSGLHRTAHRIGPGRKLAELDRLSRHADDRHFAVDNFKILLGALEMFGGKLQDFLPDDFGRLVDGVAGNHRAAARKGAGAPVELIGIAGDDVDVANRHAKLVGGDLGEHGKMPLPLRADPGRDADFAVVLHLNFGALVGANASALDVTDNADADVASLRAQSRLLLGEEVTVANHLQRLVEDRLVIAAVI